MLQMIERLPTSLTASIALKTEVQRRRQRSSSEFERVIASFEKHFGVIGPLYIAGRNRTAVITGSRSSEARNGAAKRCSGGSHCRATKRPHYSAPKSASTFTKGEAVSPGH